MKVHEIVKEKGEFVHSVGPDEPVAKAISLLNEQHVGALVVLDDARKLQGIISERDILRSLDTDSNHFGGVRDKPVRQLMTPKNRVIIAHEDDDLEYAMKIFTDNRIRHLPVYRHDDLLAIISIGDVVRALLREAQYEAKHLINYITGESPGL